MTDIMVLLCVIYKASERGACCVRGCTLGQIVKTNGLYRFGDIIRVKRGHDSDMRTRGEIEIKGEYIVCPNELIIIYSFLCPPHPVPWCA